MKIGIFLERDGVLNLPKVVRGNQVQPCTLEEFVVNTAALEPLARLKEAGFLLFVCTNQPQVSGGNLSRRDLDLMHQVLRHRFQLDDIFYCPHDETDYCNCRKPDSGLFTEAAFKWHLNLEHCFAISDKWLDADAARLVGMTSLLLKSPWIGKGHHDFVLPNLSSIADKILQLHATPCLMR